MLTALQKAKANGAIIIAINPLKEAGLLAFNNPQKLNGIIGHDSKLADVFLQVKINGDLALLQCIEQKLLEKDNASNGKTIDHEFIKNNTVGYDALTEHLASLNSKELIKVSGISEAQIDEVAKILSTKSKIIACWAMGLTQHKNAVNTIKEIVNLLLLKGSIGKPGAGTCPVRGHSNVQGDRTMGIVEKPSPTLFQSMNKTYGFAPPTHHGYDVVECIKAMHEKKAKVFIALGGDFLSATPDTLVTADALRYCKLTVQISTKLNRSHLITGDEAIILPALGRTDLDVINDEVMVVSCENSMGIVQQSKGSLAPISKDMRSEVRIVCDLAKYTLGDKHNIPWDNYAKHYDYIRNDIEKTIPGFNNYNERIRHKNGFALPNPNRVGDFATPDKKAHFNIANVSAIPLKEDELLMMTIRSHDQFNTTIYGLDDRYRGIHNERRIILMNETDIATRGLKSGDCVNIHSNFADRNRVAENFIIVPYDIPQQCCATYFPETNVLVPIESTADKSNTPTSKSVVVWVARA
jgi:molybdopterin-dependent oxidoreductase alpha subunit